MENKKPQSPQIPQSPKRPGYEYLIVYMLGKVIQDLTFIFCQKFLKHPKDPTFPNFKLVEQINGAARSNPQNIAEGFISESLSSYITLCGVAHGSNEELAKDLQDFLRQRNLPIWPKDHPRIRGFREFRVFWLPNSPNSLNTPTLPNNPAEAANLILTLCQMESFLLTKHIDSLKLKHQKEGGFHENLLKKRIQFRSTQPGRTGANAHPTVTLDTGGSEFPSVTEQASIISQTLGSGYSLQKRSPGFPGLLVSGICIPVTDNQ